jgi:hypothetical protein
MRTLAAWERNLSSLHKNAPLILHKKVVNREEYVSWLEEEGKDGKYKVAKLSAGGQSKQVDVPEIVESCSHWPMRQFYYPEMQWCAFINSFISKCYKDNLGLRVADDDCIFHGKGMSRALWEESTEVRDVGKSRAMKFEAPSFLGQKTRIAGEDGIERREFEMLVIKTGINGVFPFKKNVAAEAKQNIYFSDVLESLVLTDVSYYNRVRPSLYKVFGMTNDQACHFVMSHYAMTSRGYLHDFFRYGCYLVDQKAVKAISDLTKIMGVANNPHLTYYTEADSLLGRGSVASNAKKELDELSSDMPPEGHDIRFDKGVIKQRTMELLREAMPDVSATPVEGRWHLFVGTIDKYWANRHVGCVNGSHHLPKFMDDYEYVGTKTRMQYLENQEKAPLFKTKPCIHASLSWKLENPKVRAIKSQDTISYLCEDFMMKGVEKQWKHPEVLLNPSLGSKFLEGERLENMPGSTYVMLDYSAMDKQHSLQSQEEVIAALCQFMGAPKDMQDWYLAANRDQWLYDGDRAVKLKYSLLTGRRMTTFINTVLNYVYFHLAIGDMRPRSAFYAGDDIVTRWGTELAAKRAIDKALESKSVFNPRKQSWGKACEFLRVATKGKLTMCYANRALASFVCGSWVNKMKLAETHLPGIYCRMAWMLDNRFMLDGFARNVSVVSMAKRTKLQRAFCTKLLAHGVSVDDGPVTPYGRTVTVVKPRTRVKLKDVPEGKKLANNASVDFVAEFIGSQEKQVLKEGDIRSLVGLLTRASHMKSLTQGYEVETMESGARQIQTFEIQCNARHLKSIKDGALSKHPTLPILRGTLTQAQLGQLIVLITGDDVTKALDRDEFLFGSKAHCAAAKLGNDFDDIAQLSKAVVLEHSSMTPTVNLPRVCFT